MIRHEISAEIDRVAAEWALRVRDGALDGQDRAALDAWLAADIRRRGAFARFKAVLVQAGRIKALGPQRDEDADIAATSDAAPPDGATVLAIGRAPARRRFLAWAGSAAAATVAGVFAVLALPDTAEAFVTRRGEIRSMPLADGTQMTLNTATMARVAITASHRRITLDRGEALFEVARDAKRPFIVVAGDTEVRAVGTRFVVRHLPGQPVRVMVSEGVVEMRTRAHDRVEVQRLAANSEGVVDRRRGLSVTPVDAGTLGRELAWREGKLAFENAPLRDAADEFARYSDRRIYFDNARTAQESITGLYPVNDPVGFARAAALSLGLRAHDVPDGIVLTR